jgi:hypothetical protein
MDATIPWLATRLPEPLALVIALATKPQWRELDKFATMAGRKTRRRGEDALRALNDWEEAWRVYNYNPHTDERYASAKRAADVARKRVAALTER